MREEQRLVSENARLQSDELIKIREQEQLRQAEVAEQNRQRAVTIEQERVERAKQLEKVTTDREVQLQGEGNTKQKAIQRIKHKTKFINALKMNLIVFIRL